jgi:PIN domain nuclease of toxin-antitoxin system
MILLLDTHAVIWALEDSPRLSRSARKAIENSENLILVSAVSAWEIAIKRRLGRLEAPGQLEATVETAGFLRRNITFADVEKLEELPLHHADPFDRMLIAQALVEGVPLVTADPQFSLYPVSVLW